MNKLDNLERKQTGMEADGSRSLQPHKLRSRIPKFHFTEFSRRIRVFHTTSESDQTPHDLDLIMSVRSVS